MRADARLWQEERKPAQALASLRQASAMDPDDPSLHYEVARALEQQGRVFEALQALNEGLAHQAPSGRAEVVTWRERLQAQLDQQRRDYLLREAPAPRDGR
jgi:predicted Zn-dependent protease